MKRKRLKKEAITELAEVESHWRWDDEGEVAIVPQGTVFHKENCNRVLKQAALFMSFSLQDVEAHGLRPAKCCFTPDEIEEVEE